MELRHLRYFVTVAEEASFNRASVRLRVSQPAISRQIKTLEGELGTPLFERRNDGPKLTKAGVTLLGHARELLARSTDAVLDVQAVAGANHHAINLGYLVSVQARYLTPALIAFRKQHRALKVNVFEMTPAAQLVALRARKLDLALVGHHDADTLHDLDVTILYLLPLQAIVADEHRFAARKQLAVRELAGEKFIGYNEAAFPDRNTLITRICVAAGFNPRLEPCAESLSAVLALVGAGDGVCLIPADVARLPHPGVVFLPLQRPVPHIKFAAITRRGQTVGALADLVKCLADAANHRPAPAL